MAALIRLATASPTSAVGAARTPYSVGRALTAADFLRFDQYVAYRLLGVAPGTVGAITGLALAPARFDSADAVTGLPRLTIAPGYGVGGDGRLLRVSAPVTVRWNDLLLVVRGAGTLPDGTYLLTVRTMEYDVLEGPAPDPCLRVTADPLLDERRDSFVEVSLSSAIGGLPVDFGPAAVALHLNSLLGTMTSGALATACGHALPLALVVVRNEQLLVLSQAAGRLPAEPSGLRAMLLAQVREAFAMALLESGTDLSSAAGQQALAARFRFLPAAGELPIGLLLNPAQPGASCPFLPAGTGVYLRTIRASQAARLVRRGVARAPLDLANGVAEGVVLSLAVPDGSWTPDLMDLPRADPLLPADLHVAYARTRAAHAAWRAAWVALYGGMTAGLAQQLQMALGFLLAPDTAAPQLPVDDPGNMRTAVAAADSPVNFASWLVGVLPTLTPPADFIGPLAQQGYQVVDGEPPLVSTTAGSSVPVTSDEVLTPLLQYLPAGSGFSDWQSAVTASAVDPGLLQSLIDAGVVDASMDASTQAAAIAGWLAVAAPTDPANDDTNPGALLRLAIIQLFYIVLARAVRAQEWRLAAHNRLIAVQRLHLDLMSTSVSALAGGAPTDGSGLRFTRTLPFIKLNPSAASTSAPAAAMHTLSTQKSAIRNVASTFAPSAPITTPAPQLLQAAAFQPGAIGQVAAPAAAAPAAAAPSAAMLASVVRTAPPTLQTVIAATTSTIGSLIGSNDVAANVATEVGALGQLPTFTFPTVQYGSAAHITKGATLKQVSETGLTSLRTLMTDPAVGIAVPAPTPAPTPTGTPPEVDAESAAYAGLAEDTRSLLADIGLVERNAITIESNYLVGCDLLQALEARIPAVTQDMATARDKLRTAASAAAAAAGDYAAAQRLVQEELGRVTAAAQARTDAIGAATGLFYTRQLQTIVAKPAPAARPLIADTPADLVPGCTLDHAGPPAAVQPFLDLVLEVPLADWNWLQDRWVDLPDVAGIQRLATVRAARLGAWSPPSSYGAGAAAADLASIAQSTRSVFSPLFQASVQVAGSLALTQQAALRTFAFHDIVTLPGNGLRTEATALRARLESAAGCLSETLSALPPSTRFAWASEARAGTLAPLDFAQWPIPPGLGDAGAAAVRRVAALVGWMAGQLHDRSSAAAQTALSNFVRAAVIAAAYGDPGDAVSGTLTTVGVALRPGLPIRVQLSRPPPIGTLLHVFDANQRVVGTARITDHDALGTSASIVTNYATSTPARGWTVGVPGALAARFPL